MTAFLRKHGKDICLEIEVIEQRGQALHIVCKAGPVLVICPGAECLQTAVKRNGDFCGGGQVLY